MTFGDLLPGDIFTINGYGSWLVITARTFNVDRDEVVELTLLPCWLEPGSLGGIEIATYRIGAPLWYNEHIYRGGKEVCDEARRSHSDQSSKTPI